MIQFKNNRGQALILALVVFAVVGVLSTSLLTITSHQARMELRQVDGTILFYGAEAGIEEAKYRVKNVVGWLESKVGLAEHDIGETKVTVTVTGPVDDFYTVTSTARWSNSNLTRTVSIKAKSPVSTSMSPYMFFINNGFLDIGPRTEIWGKVHSNKNVKISGPEVAPGDIDVIFDNKVTTANNLVLYNGASLSNITFSDSGYQEDVVPIPMPEVSALDYLKTIASPDGYYPNTISVEIIDNQVSIDGAAAVPLPTNGVIFCDKDINIKGTLNGQLTVASMQTINITDNLKYADPTDHYPNTLDILGLIADKDIQIHKDAPDILEINAAMTARTGKVWCKQGPGKDTLTIKGSVCSHQFSDFASPSGRIYNKIKLHFDNNLLIKSPPYYTLFKTESFKDWRDEGE